MGVADGGSGLWLHGSPEEFSELRVGSTITQIEPLARAFSHKPSLVSVDDNGDMYHNGRREGILYRVTETVRAADLTPNPGSTFPDGQECLITRPLRVAPIARVPLDPTELLTADEEQALWRQLEQRTQPEGGVPEP